MFDDCALNECNAQASLYPTPVWIIDQQLSPKVKTLGLYLAPWGSQLGRVLGRLRTGFHRRDRPVRADRPVHFKKNRRPLLQSLPMIFGLIKARRPKRVGGLMPPSRTS